MAFASEDPDTPWLVPQRVAYYPGASRLGLGVVGFSRWPALSRASQMTRSGTNGAGADQDQQIIGTGTKSADTGTSNGTGNSGIKVF